MHPGFPLDTATRAPPVVQLLGCSVNSYLPCWCLTLFFSSSLSQKTLVPATYESYSYCCRRHRSLSINEQQYEYAHRMHSSRQRTEVAGKTRLLYYLLLRSITTHEIDAIRCEYVTEHG